MLALASTSLLFPLLLLVLPLLLRLLLTLSLYRFRCCFCVHWNWLVESIGIRMIWIAANDNTKANSKPNMCVVLLWFIRRKYRWYNISTWSAIILIVINSEQTWTQWRLTDPNPQTRPIKCALNSLVNSWIDVCCTNGLCDDSTETKMTILNCLQFDYRVQCHHLLYLKPILIVKLFFHFYSLQKFLCVCVCIYKI